MLKYSIGDHVMYGMSGACEIVEIGTLEFAGPEKVYYSLKPVYDERDTIYVPVAKEDEIARKVVGKKEAQKTVKEIREGSIEGDLPDRDTCSTILQEADGLEVANLIRHLRLLRSQNKRNHKGLNIADAKLLTYAERIVTSELAVALTLSMEDAFSMLNEALG
ncbi:MAG: hypothetical protein IKI75_08510 [Lachnospiraceae bacterium]|nr:hypothetical protein [Lachnospiraceae bacterium]